MQLLFSGISNFIQVFLVFTGFFYLFISLAGLRPVVRRPAGADRLHRFAVVMAAYNEEGIIAYALDSLLRMDYPRELFDVFLAADHCTDRTVEIARNKGVSVFPHEGALPRGKGFALKAVCDHIISLKRYDALCFFDADSLAHPDFLRQMNGHVDRGECAVQAYEEPKNPDDNWLSRMAYVSQTIFNRLYQYPKHVLGLSATLHGKGMCFTPDIMRRFPWDGTCLTEDIELQMRLIAAGVRVSFAPAAIVYDEEPTSFREHIHRSVRWAAGALDTARRHLVPLWTRAFRKRDVRAFEAAVRLTQTYRFAILLALAALIWLTHDSFHFLSWLFDRPYGAQLRYKLVHWSPLFFYPLVALLMERARPRYFLHYFLMPALSVMTGLPVFVLGALKNRKREWYRTAHTSRVSIDEISRRQARAAAED